MDTRHLRYIMEIAECGNITKAAEKLYISQSGLNQQLQKIERDLGAVLFERTTHSLEITEAGRVVAEYARNTIAAEERMRTMVSDAVDGSTGTLRINLAMEQGAQLFCRIYPLFYEKYPNITLKLMDHTVAEQYELLLKKELDIGMVMVTRHEHPELEYVHLIDERLLLGVPQTHPFAHGYSAPGKSAEGSSGSGSELPAADGKTEKNKNKSGPSVPDYPEMDLALCREEKFSLMFSGSTLRQAIDPCFEEAGFSPQILFESRGNHVAATMASNGICLTVLPESQARLYPDICWFRISSRPVWEGCMIYHKENPPRRAGRDFIAFAASVSANNPS